MIHRELGLFFNGAFKDKRIDNRANKVLGSIIQSGSVVVNKCCSTVAEKIGGYRMLNNNRVSEEQIKKQLFKNCEEHLKGTHVLCIQDTTEINYTSKQGRIQSNDPHIGPVTNNSNVGFYCHPMLVIDAQSHTPLGFSGVKIWNRGMDKTDKHARKYATQPIELKESYRWIELAKDSLANLPEDVHQTIIADRESDIYEAFYLIPSDRCDVLFRSSSNRLLHGEDCPLLEKMCSLPVAHSYKLDVKGNHKRLNREATMDLRFEKVDIKRPQNIKDTYPPYITIYCIHVVEQAQSVPPGEEPIEWRLLTSHRVETVEEAIQCVAWYKMRWFIEEIFRLLRSEGMDIESAQLETGAALKKLALIGLVAALHIMMLKIALDRKDEKNTSSMFFTESQIELLQILLKKVEGKTQKQKNPYQLQSLAWAAWIIARLAGWSGYSSHGNAGYITIKKGYHDFISKYQVFELIKDVYKE